MSVREFKKLRDIFKRNGEKLTLTQYLLFCYGRWLIEKDINNN